MLSATLSFFCQIVMGNPLNNKVPEGRSVNYLWVFPKLSSNVKRFFFRNLHLFVLPEHHGIHAILGTLNVGKFIRSDKFDYKVGTPIFNQTLKTKQKKCT